MWPEIQQVGEPCQRVLLCLNFFTFIYSISTDYDSGSLKHLFSTPLKCKQTDILMKSAVLHKIKNRTFLSIHIDAPISRCIMGLFAHGKDATPTDVSTYSAPMVWQMAASVYSVLLLCPLLHTLNQPMLKPTLIQPMQTFAIRSPWVSVIVYPVYE